MPIPRLRFPFTFRTLLIVAVLVALVANALAADNIIHWRALLVVATIGPFVTVVATAVAGRRVCAAGRRDRNCARHFRGLFGSVR